jgi:hypothetical protein
VHTCMHAHTHAHTCAHTHTLAHTHVHAHVHTYTHVHAHTLAGPPKGVMITHSAMLHTLAGVKLFMEHVSCDRTCVCFVYT